MSRSGYSDDLDSTQLNVWRGAVQSAIRGKRGQSFLKDLLAALDALPVKRLIANDLQKDGEVCAIGALGCARHMQMEAIDPEDRDAVADAFNIAGALAAEVAFENDEAGRWNETPEERYARVRRWIVNQIPPDEAQGLP